MLKMGVFYHLVVFAWKNPGRVKTFKEVAVFTNATDMEKWVAKNSDQSVWVVPSKYEELEIGHEIGGCERVAWNGRQWLVDYMGKAPYDGTKEIENERPI